MRVIQAKPGALPLVTGELKYPNSSAAAVKALIGLYTQAMVQPQFTQHILAAASKDKALLDRIPTLKNYEVVVTIDKITEENGTVTIKYTAYPGYLLQ